MFPVGLWRGGIQVFPLLVARRLNVLRRPFEIFGRYVLTQRDVQESKLIRDLIQLLVNNVLKALFPSLHLTFFDVSVDAVNITGPKLAIHGTANIAESENGVSFVLLTGVGLSGDGHILYLDQPELVLNPESKLPVKVGSEDTFLDLSRHSCCVGLSGRSSRFTTTDMPLVRVVVVSRAGAAGLHPCVRRGYRRQRPHRAPGDRREDGREHHGPYAHHARPAIPGVGRGQARRVPLRPRRFPVELVGLHAHHRPDQRVDGLAISVIRAQER